MDLALLNPANSDDDPLFRRYIRGAKAFDLLWGSGERCPRNPAGVRCKCDIPGQDYCRYFCAVEKIAEELGGVMAEVMRGIE